jgi:exodeoxyribonuclease VII large subunit
MPTPFDLPFDQPEAEPASTGSPRRVYAVSELTAEIRGLLENRWPDVWVEGELSNAKVWTTGHLYFTLKDDLSQIKGVMFRSSLRLLKFRPGDGLRIVARGRVTVYEPKGEYQLVCDVMEPHGLGALQLAFEQLKRRLQAEGLFDAARKRPLPLLPRKIGIVTSIDGAALRDIVKVLRRRHANVHLVVRPSRVQGDGAAEEIAAAVTAVARVPGVDVLIVSRGGGSIEDLWAFNEEAVARAIAACPVPVVSGVGHETDTTIADFVADVRAATPSNAAEIVVARKDELVARLERVSARLRSALAGSLASRTMRLDRALARPGLAGFHGRVAMRARRGAELAHALRGAILETVARRERQLGGLRLRLEAQDLRRRLAVVHTRLARADASLAGAARSTLHRLDRRFRPLAGRLDTLSPLAVLARGYAVCWTADRGAILRAATPDLVGEAVHVRLHRGELECEVTRVSEP